MGPFEFLIAIVAISIGGNIILQLIKRKDGGAGKQNQQEYEQLLTSVSRLEQRMQVVEEIVSSSSFELREQFTRLEQQDKAGE